MAANTKDKTLSNLLKRGDPEVGEMCEPDLLAGSEVNQNYPASSGPDYGVRVVILGEKNDTIIRLLLG